MEIWKIALLSAMMAWCLVCPPFSYLMAPRYLSFPRREWTSRVEYDHDYFGAI